MLPSKKKTEMSVWTVNANRDLLFDDILVYALGRTLYRVKQRANGFFYLFKEECQG